MADLSERPSEDRARDEGVKRPSDGDLKRIENERIDRLIIQPWLDAAAASLPPEHRGALYVQGSLSVLYEGIRAAIVEAKNQGIIARMAISEFQKTRLDDWLVEQRAKTLAAQEARGSTRKHAYHGAIGGSLTWESTPTTLGTVIKVFYCRGTPMEAEIDLTDYADW